MHEILHDITVMIKIIHSFCCEQFYAGFVSFFSTKPRCITVQKEAHIYSRMRGLS